MKNAKLSVALIGAGRAGMIHARNFKGGACRTPGLSRSPIPVEEAVQAACRELEIDRYETDYRRLLEDDAIDAVIIVTPTKYHCEIAMARRQSGQAHPVRKADGDDRRGMQRDGPRRQGKRRQAAARVHAAVRRLLRAGEKAGRRGRHRATW